MQHNTVRFAQVKRKHPESLSVTVKISGQLVLDTRGFGDDSLVLPNGDLLALLVRF